MNESAPEFNRAVLDFAVAKHVDVVFLCGRWSLYAGHPTFEPCLQKTVRALSDAGIRVVVIRAVAEFPGRLDPTLALATAIQRGTDVTTMGVPLAHHRRANERCDAIFDRLAAGNVVVLDPAPAFVDEAGLWRAEYGGESMYIDNDHLSVAGAMRLQPMFEGVLADVAAARGRRGEP